MNEINSNYNMPIPVEQIGNRQIGEIILIKMNKQIKK